MKPDQLHDVLTAHAAWLEDRTTGAQANLSGANLSGANLSEAKLGMADLIRANLSEANLSDADLSKADLSEADLREADLSEANLSEANLSWAIFSRSWGLYSASALWPTHSGWFSGSESDLRKYIEDGNPELVASRTIAADLVSAWLKEMME